MQSELGKHKNMDLCPEPILNVVTLRVEIVLLHADTALLQLTIHTGQNDESKRHSLITAPLWPRHLHIMGNLTFTGILKRNIEFLYK